MPRIATISFRSLLGADMLAQLARILLARAAPPSFVDADPPSELIPDDPELEPFIDWDAIAGRGRGYFRSDADECASRRVDLRGPTDLDPGPLPMEEASEDALLDSDGPLIGLEF